MKPGRKSRRCGAWLGFMWFGLALGAVTAPAWATESPEAAIDELVSLLSENDKLAVSKVDVLPEPLHGALVVVAEFDDYAQSWLASAAPEVWGNVGPQRVDFLGHAVGEAGFVRAVYLESNDRRVVSYTGVTTDRRLSLNIYDDESDPEHLVIQVRIGPRQLRYLAVRPAH